MSSTPSSDNPYPAEEPRRGPQGPPPPPQIIVQPQTTALGRYGKLLLVLLGLAVMTIFGLMTSYHSYFSPPGGPQERFHSLSETADEKIAIVSVSGAILEGDDFTKQQLDRVRDDDQVCAIVLRIDSPGGTVTGSDYLYHHVRQLCAERELPLVVSMGSICASGGYYIAMAVGDQQDALYAEPTTWTGSIGVVIPRYDFSGFLESHDVKDASVASHPDKLMGSPTRLLSEAQRAEELKLFQALVDQSFEGFKEIVRSGRPKFKNDDEGLKKVATGQIFTASQALELGLVDRIGFIEDAIKRAAELAGRDPAQLRCVQYEQPPTTLGSLLSARAPSTDFFGNEVRNLLELSVPRAYYLCTGIPHLALPSLLQTARP